VTGRAQGLAACGAALAGLTALGLFCQTRAALGGFVAVALVQGAVYLAAASLVWRGGLPQRATNLNLGLILGLALALRLAILAFPPFLSDDVYRYVWDGRVMAAGINPYRYVPEDPHLAALLDDTVSPNINRSHYARTIYPPVAQASFFAITRLWDSVFGMKAAMIASEAVAAVLTLSLLAAAAAPPERILLTGAALAAAALVKFFPAVILPACYRRWDWQLPAAFAGVVAAGYLPFLGAGTAVLGFLPGYADEEGFDRSAAGFYLWNALKAVLPLDQASGLWYLAAAAIAIAALSAAILFVRPVAVSPATGAAVLATAFMLLLSPHYPWYFAWLVVFVVLVPNVSVSWLTLSSFLLYLVPTGMHIVADTHRLLVESVIYLPFLVLAGLDIRRYRRRLPDPRHPNRSR
jgi:hypothetical protein